LAPGRIKAKRRKRRKSRAPRDLYSVVSYPRAIHRACDLAKIERWSPNRLRHTAATRVRREMGIDAARALLGHSDADTTTIYAERDQELARTAMERLGSDDRTRRQTKSNWPGAIETPAVSFCADRAPMQGIANPEFLRYYLANDLAFPDVDRQRHGCEGASALDARRCLGTLVLKRRP
jgi:hypothetical protein